MGEQARQMSYALALASKPALVSGQAGELTRVGQDLLKARNIVFVAFLDAEARPLAQASRDPDFTWSQNRRIDHNIQSLMQVQHRTSPVLGDYLEIAAPVLSVPTLSSVAVTSSSTRLLGYVVLGVSQSREQAQLRRINCFIVVLTCLIAALSFPLAFVLVRRIFQPIRHLVQATRKIAAGDLDTQVATHRSDIIGTLARSFNEMVNRVRRQQEELEDKVRGRTAELQEANHRLSREIAEKEDFLRAVSHDLNAPLRNIAGMVAMLLMKHRDSFDEDAIRRLHRIEKNVEAETDLISELLELSRIKTRRQRMECVEIAPLLTHLSELFDSDLKSNGIDFVVDTPMPVLYCEKSHIRQVFQNLIDNAIKYMGDGPHKEIHVGCAARAAGRVLRPRYRHGHRPGRHGQDLFHLPTR